MKNTRIMNTAIVIWALALIFNLNTTLADEKSVVFEMAESGQTVSFPMTAEEMAAADADREKAAVRPKTDAARTRATVLIYEVGEGGHRITFPSTLTDPGPEDRSDRKHDDKALAGAAESDSRVLTFEMAESGLLIEFPDAVKVIVIHDENAIAARPDNES